MRTQANCTRECQRRWEKAAYSTASAGLSSAIANRAAVDVDDHALTVDITDLQSSQFCTPHPGGIQGHQNDAMKGCKRRVDKARDFFLAENHRQVQRLFGIRSLSHTPALLERLDIEEPQGCQPLRDGLGANLNFLNSATWYSRMWSGPN